MESSAMGSNMESSATIGSNVESELYIGLNNTIAEDSGIYTCQVILTINGIDTFTASDTSTILIRGEHVLEQFIFYIYIVYNHSTFYQSIICGC